MISRTNAARMRGGVLHFTGTAGCPRRVLKTNAARRFESVCLHQLDVTVRRGTPLPIPSATGAQARDGDQECKLPPGFDGRLVIGPFTDGHQTRNFVTN
jgi:hypothetical protein